MKTALGNITVLDLSRVLAGPYCTQMLGDMGAEIIKIERLGGGDDTRQWGPPYLQDDAGQDTSESAYYLSCNRNKKSIAIDIRTEQGQDLLHKLIEKADILIHNFKVGGLEKYGLGYEQLKQTYPSLIYCAISGYGQQGPLSKEPGYDFVAQALSGLMASTGEPEGAPMKAGVALSDIMTGLNAAIAILAALNFRNVTGQGQMVDVALTDCTLAAMTNLAQYYLTSGHCAPRRGNAHATIVPYQVFEAQDGHVVLAIGNDSQFARFAKLIGQDTWAENEAYKSNKMRVKNREELCALIQEHIERKNISYWVDECEKISVPCSPVNTIEQAFAMEQIQTREMQIEMKHPLKSEEISLVGSPLKFSESPVHYEAPPPLSGQHTHEILSNMLKISDVEIEQLRNNKIID